MVRLKIDAASDNHHRVATNRNDLTAEEIAEVYKPRWSIATFFGWWKRHLKVYHLIARSKYGLMVQLLNLYCANGFDSSILNKFSSKHKCMQKT
jgi:IS4 transposase